MTYTYWPRITPAGYAHFSQTDAAIIPPLVARKNAEHGSASRCGQGAIAFFLRHAPRSSASRRRAQRFFPRTTLDNHENEEVNGYDPR